MMHYGEDAGVQKMQQMNRLGASAECHPKRTPEIRAEFDRLTASIDALTANFIELGAKLAPVTRQEPVANENKLGLPPSNTQLGDMIRGATLRIEELRLRVVQQIELTEL